MNWPIWSVLTQQLLCVCVCVFFLILYLIFTADKFTCFTRTYMHNQNDTVVNWLLEQFVTLYVLARFFGAIN